MARWNGHFQECQGELIRPGYLDLALVRNRVEVGQRNGSSADRTHLSECVLFNVVLTSELHAVGLPRDVNGGRRTELEDRGRPNSHVTGNPRP